MSNPKWAIKVVKIALLFAIVALFVCGFSMSRAGCPGCLEEFASNGVKLDVLALEMPANGDELRRTLRVFKPFSQTVRNTYEKQTNVDDVFLWLYPAQFVLACFYFALTGGTKLSRLLLIAASLAILVVGWLDQSENVYIHATLRDSGAHFNQLAREVARISMQKWPCFGLSAFLAAAGLALRMREGGPNGLSGSATGLLCAALMSTCSLVILGLATGNRSMVGWSAVPFAIFPLAVLWLLYLKQWAEITDGWLRSRLGLPRRFSSGTI